mmetsp:Transcript_27286/g.52908  ORF Transcript_27286/g.52908 Transcript_27286/m.52908 type:complete len:89 (+) Transcript_27286:729-995(+)
MRIKKIRILPDTSPIDIRIRIAKSGLKTMRAFTLRAPDQITKSKWLAHIMAVRQMGNGMGKSGRKTSCVVTPSTDGNACQSENYNETF